LSRSSCAILSLRVGRSFSRISVGKIHLSFSRVLCGSHGFVTASLVYSAADFSGFARGSMVDVLLLHPCFNTFSRGFLAASPRRRFLFVRSLFDGVFDRRKRDILVALSPLRLCGPCLLRRAGAGRVAVDYSMPIRSVRTWQNPTFKNLIKLNIQNAEKLRKPIFRPARTCQNLTFENTTNYYIRSRSHPLGRWESGFCDCSII